MLFVVLALLSAAPSSAPTSAPADATTPPQSDAAPADNDVFNILNEQEELGLFDIFSEQEQVIVSAARRKQKRAESPLATTIISSDEIRRSGLWNVAELLRRYAGMDVAQTTAGSFSVGIRGTFSTYTSNKVLLLIDGRSLLVDVFGTMNWNQVPVALSEIERIEIVRGPGSTLFGANAFSGIVNIVTKRAESSSPINAQIVGALSNDLSPRLSGRNVQSHVVHSASIGDIVSYRLSGGYDELHSFADTPDAPVQQTQIVRGSGDINFTLTPTKRLRLAYQGAGGRVLLLTSSNASGTSVVPNADGAAFAEYTESKPFGVDGSLFARAGYRYNLFQNANSPSLAVRSIRNYVRSVFAEAVYSKAIIDTNILTVGIDTKYTLLDWFNVAKPIGSQIFYGSLYAQDEWRPIERLILTAGLRAEVQAYPASSGVAPFFYPSPRLSVVSPFVDGHVLRVSAGRAFRAPNAFDLFARFDPPVFVGNPRLRPEEVWNVDLGYSFTSEVFDATVSAFVGYNIGLLGLSNSIPIINTNEQNAISFGGEAEAVVKPSKLFLFRANYSYQNFIDPKTGQAVAAGPPHKLNAQVDFDLPYGFEVNLAAGWVDNTPYFALIDTTSAERISGLIAPRTYIDFRLGWRSNFGLELFIAGYNVNRFRETSPEFAGAADRIGGRIMGGVAYTFGQRGFNWMNLGKR
jgi:outer membrane receptor protein involved in Fe transport